MVDIKVNSIEHFRISSDRRQDVMYATVPVPKPYIEFIGGETGECIVHNYYLGAVADRLKKRGIDYRLDIGDKFRPYVTGDDSLLDAIDINTPLYKHQKEGIKFEMTHQNFIIGDEQGLGKTLELIALATSLKRKGAKHVMVICGVAGNVYNWKDEIERHSNERCYILGSDKKNPKTADKIESLTKPHDEFFYVTNIETIRAHTSPAGKKRGRSTYPFVDAFNELAQKGEISLLAIDECQKIKSPTTWQAKAAMQLKCKRLALLSGTLVMNSPLDLYVPMRMCHIIKDSYYTYKNYYCTLGGYAGAQVSGYKNLDHLKKLLAPIFLRRTKDDVLDLPDKIEIEETIELDAKQRLGYSALQVSAKNDFSKISHVDNPLAMMLYLRRYLAAPELEGFTSAKSPKMARLMEIVDNVLDNPKGKALIYSQWSTVTEIARERLSKLHPAYVTGKVGMDDRMKEIEKFQSGKTRVIIGTIGALGTGFTLNTATDVIFLDEPWNMATKAQATDRAHRIGTRYPVNVHTLICRDTIDEYIRNIVREKGAIADDLLETGGNRRLTASEIWYLITGERELPKEYASNGGSVLTA